MDDDVGFLYKTMIERDPNKRRVKPVETAAASLIDFDLGESSDDSDFRIEDHCEESDDSVDSNGDGKDNGDDDDDDSSSDSDSSETNGVLGKKNAATNSVADLLEKARLQAEKGEPLDEKLTKMLICCGCLGDRSDDVNEIVECDGCGVTVHEGCYGVSDVESFSSTDSLSQSAPWFCEACSAGVEDPDCELCPNKGGIFKETDVGKWVHLVCALYVPGVAFGEVDKLTSVTLFEMQYSKYGAKPCFLCEDIRYARTGVCIECDAGMCHTYFHVTCAQREGLLSEAHHEEADQADPFYAHCKLHSDKTLVRKRKRNWLTLQLRASYRQQMLKKPEYRETEEFKRIQRKLTKHRQKYLAHKATKPPPWVPTQKMPRMLTTSASAIRALTHKADLMGIDAMALEAQEEQIASLVDIRKKWHIPPAFTVEFISYYLDRNVRITSMKKQLDELLQANTNLLVEQQELDKKYDEAIKVNEDHMKVYGELKSKIELYHRVLKSINYTKPLPTVEDMARPKIQHNSGPIHSTPTATIVKAEICTQQSPNKSNDSIKIAGNQISDQNCRIPLHMRHQCGICRRATDQHLLAKCDTCHLHYHLNCLTPPLARMPKKTKLMGWQCSECDKESSGSEPELVDTSAPRRLRHCKEEPREPPPLPSMPPPPLQPPPPPPPPPPTSTSCVTTIVEEAIVHKPPSTKTSPKKQQQKSPLVNNHNNSTQNNSVVHHTPKFTFKPMEPQTKVQRQPIDEYNFNNHIDNNSIVPLRESSPVFTLAPLDGISDRNSSGRGKKRRREKHKRYSPDPLTGEKQKKRKHKRKSLDIENPLNQASGEVRGRILLKIKPIPMPAGEVASESNPQLFVASSTTTEFATPKVPQNLYKFHSLPTAAPVPPVQVTSTQSPLANTISNLNSISTPPAPEQNANRRISSGARKPKDADLVADCKVCNTVGTYQNSVMCDECKKSYHFTCLDPPVKKSPKRRGYSWHCADCDPSEPETEN